MFSDTYIVKTSFKEVYRNMKTDERIRSLHMRMDALRRARQKRKTGAIGIICVVLTAFLFFLIFGKDGHLGSTASLYSGSAMLFGKSGIYVLIAIIAFMLGVIITVVIIRKRRK